MTVYRQLQIMRTGMKSPPNGANIFVARQVFKRDVLRIHLSDLDKGLEKQPLGTKERSCVKGMFIEMLSTEPSCWTDSIT